MLCATGLIRKRLSRLLAVVAQNVNAFAMWLIAEDNVIEMF